MKKTIYLYMAKKYQDDNDLFRVLNKEFIQLNLDNLTNKQLEFVATRIRQYRFKNVKEEVEFKSDNQ